MEFLQDFIPGMIVGAIAVLVMMKLRSKDDGAPK